MVITWCSPELFGFRVHISFDSSNPPAQKMLDWIVEKHDTELWVGSSLHIIVSNEHAYRIQRNKQQEE